VLIADDEPDMRVLVSHVLRAEAIDVIEATDADETLAQWRELRPDVILLDQRMPPTNGLEVAEAILAEEPGQVIFLFTAWVDADVRSKAEALGIAACVSKDHVFEIAELARAHVRPG
jgi:CheY-like chemotaxis protein